MGGDEVNILAAGHNYGWPLVSMGRNYTGTLASDQPFARPGMDNARMFWVPSISPSSIMFYTGDKFPRWKNNLFVGALTTQAAHSSRVRSAVSGGTSRRTADPAAACASATSNRVPTATSTLPLKAPAAGMPPTAWCLRIEPADPASNTK